MYMYEEETTLVWNLFGLEMSPYAGFVGIGALLGVIAFCAVGRKLKWTAVLCTLLLGVPLAALGARAFYVLARWSYFAEEIGFSSFFRAQNPDSDFWGAARGGAFWGAVGGGALAALAAGRLTKTKVSDLLDALAPAAALTLAVSRFGEYSIGEGIGPDVTPPELCFFPIAVSNEWGEWKYALFLLEGLTALVIFLWLVMKGKERTGGYRARAFLILYSACQVLLEALRRDNFLRWLFVRVSQVTCGVVMLFLFVFAVIRWLKRPEAVGRTRRKNEAEKMSAARVIFCGAAFLLLTGAVVALEFAVDKSPDMPVATAYGLEALCAAGMGVSVWQVAMKN